MFKMTNLLYIKFIDPLSVSSWVLLHLTIPLNYFIFKIFLMTPETSKPRKEKNVFKHCIQTLWTACAWFLFWNPFSSVCFTIKGSKFTMRMQSVQVHPPCCWRACGVLTSDIEDASTLGTVWCVLTNVPTIWETAFPSLWSTCILWCSPHPI